MRLAGKMKYEWFMNSLAIVCYLTVKVCTINGYQEQTRMFKILNLSTTERILKLEDKV